MDEPKGPRFVLEVLGGQDHGARLEIDGRIRTIGRALDADLVLQDRGVSRRHVQVVANEDGIQLQACEGASAFVVAGRSYRAGQARPGDRILVGNTVLVLEAKAASVAPEAGSPARTDVRTLLTGIGADALAMIAVYGLIEALDAADKRESLNDALVGWAARHVPGGSVEVVPGAGAADVLEEEVEGALTSIVVPAPSDEPTSLRFSWSNERGAVTDAVRRMLVVAGRLFGSALSRSRRAEVAAGEVAALRTLSFGTARDFVGSSPAAAQLASRIPRISASDASVLLQGETGVGKTFVARLLHESSPRAQEPLRVINCAAIPEALLESELFGHERGAFTGAVAQRIGALESAGRGTLFLDEIGELSLGAQAKLLRALEDRRFERLGSNRTIEFRARLISATNRDLDAMIAAERFRQDLLFRIAVVRLRVPALRERDEDVISLAKQLLSDAMRSAGRRITAFSPDAIAAIRAYAWPGNVRELRNAIEHAIVNCDGSVIEANALPDAVLAALPREPVEGIAITLPARQAWLDERNFEAALAQSRGNITKAAAVLGMNRVSLHKRLRRKQGPA